MKAAFAFLCYSKTGVPRVGHLEFSIMGLWLRHKLTCPFAAVSPGACKQRQLAEGNQGEARMGRGEGFSHRLFREVDGCVHTYRGSPGGVG